jgi:hypothetical protein
MFKPVVVIVATVALIFAPSAMAVDKKPKKKAAAPTVVTLTNDQFMSLLSMIIERPSSVSFPSPGAAGKDGQPGQRGKRGERGEPGVAGVGVPGERGADGAPGRDGVGFASGVVFLVNGSCPTGSTMQGPQNRWTVYANDTSGRPWTTTGSSAQLFLSACQVD